MKTKRFFAMLLAMCMMLSAINIQASASVESPTTAESNYLVSGFTARPKISLVYMEKDLAAGAKDCQYKIVEAPELSVGDVFYVGVKIEGFTQYKEVTTNGNGLFSISAPILFNKAVVVPEPSFLTSNEIDPATDDWDATITEAGGGDVLKDSLEERINFIGSFFPKNGLKYAGFQNDAIMFKNPLSINIDPDGSSRGVKNPKIIGMASSYNTATGTPSWKEDSFILGIYEFKLMSIPESGTKLFDFSAVPTDLTISFGVGGAAANYKYGNSLAEDFAGFTDLDVSAVDFFPAGAATLDALESSGTLANQYDGKSLNLDGITLKYAYSDGSKRDVAEADVKYYYAASDSVTNVGDLTEITGNLSKATHDGKYLYAVAKNKIAKIGALSVADVVIDQITGVEGAPTVVYADQTISFGDGFKANVHKNDGSTATIPYAAFATNGLDVYKVTVADGSKTYAKVESADKYALGDNLFAVAKAGGITANTEPYEEFTVTAAYDAITLSTSDNNSVKTNYTAGTNFDPTGIKVNTKKITESTPTEVSYSGFTTAGLTVVIAEDETAALTASEATSSTTITADMISNAHKIYVVVNNNGTKSVLEVGTLGASTVSVKQVSGITSEAKTYGDTLGNGISVTLQYSNGDTDKTVNYSEFTANNITMKIGDETVTADTVLKPSMTGKKVDFYLNGVKIGSSVELNVNKKTVGYSAGSISTKIEREYTGDTTLPTDAAINLAINADDMLASDKTTFAGITIDGVTAAYSSKAVGTHTIIFTGTPASKGANKADFDALYTLVALTDANNKVTDNDKINITKKTLNVTKVTGVPSIEVGTETLTGTSTLALSTDNSNIVAGENVTLSYTYTYSNSTSAADSVAVGISNGSITGTDADNYTLGTVVTTATGKITNKKLNSISVDTVTNTAKISYTYPDTKLDLSGMKIDLNYDGASEPTSMTVADFIADGGIISLTDASGQSVTVTAENMTNAITLPYGETTITITYGGKTTQQTITAAKKKISASDVTFNASKVYGNDEVTGTYTFNDGVIVAGDDVTVNAKYTFTDTPETAGSDKNVKISEITLAGDKAGNYELDFTETTINTGVVSVGTQAAPAVPTVTLDSETNNVIITGPIGDNIEYSIDGGSTWVTETTFANLGNGTNVTVQARIKASDDGNLAASEPSSTSVTTYKYFVQAIKAKSTTVVKSIYTNDIASSTSDKDVNSKIFTAKPSKFKAYFSDYEGKIAQTYPLTADSDGNVTLYMTQTSSSGGSASYKVTFNVGENGTITKGNATYYVSSKLTSIPTVTAKEGYKFVGWTQDGTTAVDPLTVKIAKATTFTALYEPEVAETPAPTVEPTEEPNEPIIDIDYTAPYASGYEDGTFRPENNITRAELAAMIARLSYGGEIPDGMYNSSFPDVDEDAWYNKYIAYLEDKDVLSGYEDGTFRPNNTIARGEISAVIARAQRYEIMPYSGMFVDVIDYDWAKDYIETLATKNIVSGYEDGTFGPYLPLTRAEAVAIINRVLAPSTPVETFVPEDIAGHWAEQEIILAINERTVNGTETVDMDTNFVPEMTGPAMDNSDVTPEENGDSETTTETEETEEVPAE